MFATVVITVEVPVEGWSEEYDVPAGEVAEDAGRYLINALGFTYAALEGLVTVTSVEVQQ